MSPGRRDLLKALAAPAIVRNLQALGIAVFEIMSGHIQPFASVM